MHVRGLFFVPSALHNGEFGVFGETRINFRQSAGIKNAMTRISGDSRVLTRRTQTNVWIVGGNWGHAILLADDSCCGVFAVIRKKGSINCILNRSRDIELFTHSYDGPGERFDFHRFTVDKVVIQR